MTESEQKLLKDFPWLEKNFIVKDRKIKIKKGDENLFMMKASGIMDYFIITGQRSVEKLDTGRSIHEFIEKNTSEIVSISQVSFVMTIYKLSDEIKEEFFYERIGEKIISFVNRFGRKESMDDRIKAFIKESFSGIKSI